MPIDRSQAEIGVFDLGGTWFRWGRYVPSRGLLDPQRAPAVSYLSHPHLNAAELQEALIDFILRRAREMRDAGSRSLRVVSISVGAPVNAHDMTVLGSGPLWGPAARPLKLHAALRDRMPELQWHIVNDLTALLTPYAQADESFRKTLLLTISTGIGSRLYDHQAGRIPYDRTHGVQGEIGHLVITFELDGKVLNRLCECGGWNHLNAFGSGRGIAAILEQLPVLSSRFADLFPQSPQDWSRAGNDYRTGAFRTRLDEGNESALKLLEALVTPVSRSLAAAVSLDPDIDRIIMTGGVIHGLGRHYRAALQRVFRREGLYQITQNDPDYLNRRLHWKEADDLGGLRGAGIYAASSAASDAR